MLRPSNFVEAAMKSRAILSDVPPASAINAQLPNANFYDCYGISVPDADTNHIALAYFLKAMGNSPAWTNSLMVLRNKVVRLFGLKDLGGFGGLNLSKHASDYAPGDRVGIFTLISNSPHEALLGDSDKHLDVVLSVFKHSPTDGYVTISVTTVVHVHNFLGRIYMLPVKPLHKLIAPAVISRISGNPKEAAVEAKL